MQTPLHYAQNINKNADIMQVLRYNHYCTGSIYNKLTKKKIIREHVV